KDYSLPNASWSPDMVGLYNELLEKTTAGSWRRLPSYLYSGQFLKNFKSVIRNSTLVRTTKNSSLRFLTKMVAEKEGHGFEYAIFHNPLEKKCICLFQPGPHLEGLPGIIHGGALGTMIDSTFFITAYRSADAIFTGTMTIVFKSPVILGSVVRLEARVTGTEGRKVFLSCEAQNSDRTVLFAEASDCHIPLHPQEGMG
uniref:Thioesterase domain-containing protein n=1 Tax=Loxodonta africana TaxID=9785 RepID=G3U666_LOXAF